MTLSDELLASWHLVLCDEDPLEMLAAARYLAKTKPGVSFCPADLISANFELRHPLCNPEAAWARGPGKTETEMELRTWLQWGGPVRFGTLPDPRYCEDPSGAERTLSFARSEFIALFKSNHEAERKQVPHLTHSDSVKALSTLNRLGVNTQKLIG